LIVVFVPVNNPIEDNPTTRPVKTVRVVKSIAIIDNATPIMRAQIGRKREDTFARFNTSTIPTVTAIKIPNSVKSIDCVRRKLY
jgi:hypothetical protein